jgi:hypothetical protein
MRHVLGVLIVLGLVIPSVAVAGGTYRWVDKNGHVTYSDQPPPAGQTAAPSEASTSSAPPAPGRLVHPAASELLELSGLKEQMNAVVLQARDQIHQSVGHLEPRDLKGVQAVTERTLGPEQVFADIVGELSQLMDDTKIGAVRTWFGSPLGRQLTDLEIRASSSPDRQRRLTAFVAEWQVKPPTPARVALIQRLDAASGTTELTIDTIVGITQAVVRVADPHLAPDRRLKPGQLEAQARQIRLYTLETLRQSNAVAMLYCYRDVQDQDLARYIQFLETEAGAWFGGAVRRSIVHALSAAVERTATNLVRVVPPQRWGGPGAFKKPPLPPADKRL